MKHLLALAIILCISLLSFAQQFDGVSISGDYNQAIERYKAKGYKVTKYDGNFTFMLGMVNGTQVELLLIGTLKTKQFCKAVVYLPKKSTWESLKGNYQDYLGLLTTKYGKPSSSYSFFKEPYYEGDGYELTAVKAEKCVYAAYWLEMLDNTSISLTISEYQQVQINYENERLMELYKKEKDILNGNSF